MFLASHFYLIDFFLVAPSFRAGFFSEENKGLQSLNFYSITMLINLAFFCLSKRKQERKGHPAELRQSNFLRPVLLSRLPVSSAKGTIFNFIEVIFN
jgi:hypothetical protein